MAGDPVRPSTLARASGEAYQVVSFVEPETGVQWIAFEGRPDPSASEPRCLYFVSEAAIRRVCHYPREWAELSDVELLRLSWDG